MSVGIYSVKNKLTFLESIKFDRNIRDPQFEKRRYRGMAILVSK